jgi:hypothetical protein
LSDEVVLLFVRTDPEPHNEIGVTAREGSKMVSDSYGPNISKKRFELRRWMKRIVLPNSKLVSRETLDVRR